MFPKNMGVPSGNQVARVVVGTILQRKGAASRINKVCGSEKIKKKNDFHYSFSLFPAEPEN